MVWWDRHGPSWAKRRPEPTPSASPARALPLGRFDFVRVVSCATVCVFGQSSIFGRSREETGNAPCTDGDQFRIQHTAVLGRAGREPGGTSGRADGESGGNGSHTGWCSEAPAGGCKLPGHV